MTDSCSDHQDQHCAEKAEFIALVGELLQLPGEEREAEIFERLDQISPDPAYSDYIYHCDDYCLDDDSMNINKLAQKVFSYQPLII